MGGTDFSSVTEQVVRHLEDELRRGRWRGLMPGRGCLVSELGVSGKTVELALKRLEEKGVLEGTGAGRRRRIVAEVAQGVRPALRVGILHYDAASRGVSYIIDLQHRLEDEGHVVAGAQKTLLDMRRKVSRVADFVAGHEADAWVVVGGSRDVLEWFATQPVPAFALFGRRRGVRIAGGGPDKVPAMREVVRRLMGLGHRRVVLIAREERRKPVPGAVERAFLEALSAEGVETGSYHLPDWVETPEGFLRCLEGLFRSTPPTALVLDEAFMLMTAQQYLARRGILAPEQVSLVCCDPDPMFDWLRPRVAHIRWNPQPVIRRIVRWVGRVAHGKEDLRQSGVYAVFVEGGTVGPAAGL